LTFTRTIELGLCCRLGSLGLKKSIKYAEKITCKKR
jgi:hypothetical protein